MKLDDAISSIENLSEQLKKVRAEIMSDNEECDKYYLSIKEPAPKHKEFPEIFCLKPGPAWGVLVEPVFELETEPVVYTSEGAEIVDKPHKEHVDTHALVIRPKNW